MGSQFYYRPRTYFGLPYKQSERRAVYRRRLTLSEVLRMRRRSYMRSVHKLTQTADARLCAGAERAVSGDENVVLLK